MRSTRHHDSQESQQHTQKRDQKLMRLTSDAVNLAESQ